MASMLASKHLPLQPYYFDNHKSSTLDPKFISDYIRSEQAAGRYSQAYSITELESLIGPFRTSPLGLVPKPGSSSFRMIQDLSFPRENRECPSVNWGVNAGEFPTAWGSFDIAANLILSLPDSCSAATFDISAAYRITLVKPEQQSSLCIQWEGAVYVDRAVMFGLVSSSGVFGAVADMLVAIYKAAGWSHIIKWVDDFLVIRSPGESWTEDDFINLTSQIGVPWSRAKTRALAECQHYIGFDWDLRRKTVALPQEKHLKIIGALNTWLTPGSTFKAREAMSFHGKLVHVSSIHRLIRPFLRQLAKFASSYTSSRAKRSPPAAVLADLSWVKYIIRVSPHSLPLCQRKPVDVQWWGDASSSFGIGVAIAGCWAAWKWKDAELVGQGCERDIGWAEAVAVELGLRLLLHLDLPDIVPGATVLVRSDNQGVVWAVNQGRSRNAHTNRVLKEMYRLLASAQLHLAATYIRSATNIADSLSRGKIQDFLLIASATRQISIHLPEHLNGFLAPWYG